jgi:DNA-binding XRE family transcriptional regulator
MPRRITPSTNLLARVRAWFGLDQAALALYLGVSLQLVRSIETGRRALTTDLFLTLRPLVQQLPPAEATAPAPAALPPGLPAPEAEELDFRRRVCAAQAAKLGRELAALEERARVAAHWAQALPALQQAAADAFAAPATADEAERGTWLTGWLTRQARPLPAEVGTRWHLLRARLAALTAEMAALEGSAALPQA